MKVRHDRQRRGVRRRQDRALGNQAGLLHRRHRDAEPDGVQKAVAVHIFPENQRGAAEGFRPWDQRPGSTMTNATVAETVKGTDGQNILVKYTRTAKRKSWCRRTRRLSPSSPATSRK